jgi:hypothetical protein
MLDALPYRHVIAADFEFEFGGHAGNRPCPVCMVAQDLRTGQTWQLWRGEFDTVPPFPVGADAVFIAYTPVPNSAAFVLSAGRCRPTCSISL